MIEERLLGFDARELWADPDDLWDEARRCSFLLRVDAPKPLSVDTLVWPSIFDTGQGIGMPSSERRRFHMAGLLVPSWIGPNAGLWENLAGMRQFMDEHWAERRPHALIAVSWFSDRSFANAGTVGPYAQPTRPAKRSSGWKALGFDVADGSLVSGLTNCGYEGEEIESLRLQWGSRLNARHLFVEAADAFAFRDLANTRVLEHAPCFVYALHVVEEISWLWLEP